MEWFEPLESSLEDLVTLTKFVLEVTSVACVILGLWKTAQLAISLNRRHSSNRRPFPFNKIRLRFGVWLGLALEFQLGADIVGTTVAPTPEALGRLALIAIIRTFLNYFLSKEVEAEIAFEKEQSQAPEGESSFEV